MRDWKWSRNNEEKKTLPQRSYSINLSISSLSVDYISTDGIISLHWAIGSS